MSGTELPGIMSVSQADEDEVRESDSLALAHSPG